MSVESIRIVGQDRKKDSVRVKLNSGYSHWVANEQYQTGDEISIPQKEYLEAPRKFQLVESKTKKQTPQTNKAMNGEEKKVANK